MKIKQSLAYALTALSSCLLVQHAYALADIQLDNSANGSNIIQRSITNLDFSEPNIATNFNNTGQRGTGATNVALPETLVPGWRTTHSSRTANEYWQTGRLIEIWRGQGVATDRMTGEVQNSTNQFAELNAEEESVLYQNICLIKGETFNYSFQHATRATTSEKARFSIGTVTEGSSTAKRTWTNHQNIVTETSTQSNKTWKTYRGSVTVNSIPKASGIYSFGFEAISTGTVGNFLDKISISGLKPVVEFATSNHGAYENVNQLVPIPFRMVGNVTNTSMPTLKYQVKYSSTTPLSERAIYGVDYVIKKRVGVGGTANDQYQELTAGGVDLLVKDDQGNVTFSYKPNFNSNLDYERGVEFNGLVIEIKDNNRSVGSKNLPISFETTADVLPMSLVDCNVANIKNSLNFTIKEDDTDLEVVKTLATESAANVFKDQYINYKIELSNNTRFEANDVTLKDTIFANLSFETTGVNAATLTCEAVTSQGVTTTCPTLPADAVTQLFSANGLNIGMLEGYGKLRFSLNKLKVKDDATGEHAGYVTNQVSVTTSSTDILASNNSSTAKTLMASKVDLSNDKTGAAANETGVGYFNIAKEGRTGTTPLISQQADSDNKVYFPLKIQNFGSVAHDYQLYVSSSEIKPKISTGDYSDLDKTNASTLIADLKIDFIRADTAQCKKGVVGQLVTQLNVSATSTVQVCAVVSLGPTISTTTRLWFAIDSYQSGLGDIILNAVTPQAKQRKLELSNDQTAQVNIGGSHIFTHRLVNYGTESEGQFKVSLVPQNRNDGFIYSVYVDQNNNDVLDASDLFLTAAETELSQTLAMNQALSFFIKVEAPMSASNGMTSQVRLVVKPNNVGRETVLADLVNTDFVTVSPNQLKITKSQVKVEQCNFTNANAVINASYTVQNESLKPQQCLIYQIMVKNTGSTALNNVTINDVYPVYTKPWVISNALPIVGSAGQNITHATQNKIEDDGSKKIKATLKELLSQQEKSLYFGIKMQD